MRAATVRSSAPRAARRTVTVRAGLFQRKPAPPKKAEKKSSGGGLFGSLGSKPKPAEPPAKKSGGIGGLFGGKAAAKPEPSKKKTGGLFGGSSKAKPAAPPAKRKAAAPPRKSQIGTIKAGTKKIGTKRITKKQTSPDGTELPFFGDLKEGGVQLFRSDDERYFNKAVSGTKAEGAQKIVGYKGSGQKGSAPQVDAQGRNARFGGVVYRYADKYNGNIDEFSPIFTPETRLKAADVYEPGAVGLAIWFAGFVGLLAVGGFAIYSTSALAG
ncbi:chloroplast photosystem II protein PsbR [Chloropicon primus]|uniref:Chloroplast photosystem II protein PsbR n=1 Tax=Chloropicon primus TaxID=1764295 RepID=A0A5B8MDS5_9CHLO|nr:chloroplast photosystem II protein PsbR [Chloropicon primus]|eukprot:QDZ18758.1 chloroplast photosystem II protein PsbR [Chloropicon primus]